MLCRVSLVMVRVSKYGGGLILSDETNEHTASPRAGLSQRKTTKISVPAKKKSRETIVVYSNTAARRDAYHSSRRKIDESFHESTILRGDETDGRAEREGKKRCHHHCDVCEIFFVMCAHHFKFFFYAKTVRRTKAQPIIGLNTPLTSPPHPPPT